MKSTFDFKDAMEELQGLKEWFESEDIDLNESLDKYRRGKQLIELCRKYLANVENELETIEKEFDDND